MSSKYAPLIGKLIDTVTVSPDKTVLSFLMLTGQKISYEVEADCCSQSWIESLEVPNEIRGAIIWSVEESDEVVDDDWDGVVPPRAGAEERDDATPNSGDVIKVFQVKFNTAFGSIVAEFRNDSNGYYGGSLSMPVIQEQGNQ